VFERLKFRKFVEFQAGEAGVKKSEGAWYSGRNGRFETKNEADIYVCGYYRGLQMAAFLTKTEPEEN
jgi:hypothetical protein